MDLSSICDILKHLVRYMLVRALANKVPADVLMNVF